MADNTFIFKVVLIGERDVGKTTFVKRLKTGDYNKTHAPTIGADKLHLSFKTNHGKVFFTVLDIEGLNEDDDLDEIYNKHQEYHNRSDAAIVMFAYDNPMSINRTLLWRTMFGFSCSGVPTVLCGNKMDVKEHKVSEIAVESRKHCYDAFVEMSVKHNKNVEKPFLYLARMLTGHDDLIFLEEDANLPPTVQLDRVSTTICEIELMEAQHANFSDDSEDG